MSETVVAGFATVKLFATVLQSETQEVLLMKFKEILEKAKRNQGITNNDDLWPLLNISKAKGYRMQKGETPLQEEQALRLAELTGWEAAQIEAVWKAEFSRSPAMRQSWQKFARVASVAVFSLAVTLSAALPALGGTSLYLLCKIVSVGRCARLTPIKTLA